MRRFQLTNDAGQTLSVWSPNPTDALASASADFLRGPGPVFRPVTCEPSPELPEPAPRMTAAQHNAFPKGRW